MNQFSHQRWTRRQALWLVTGAIGSVGLKACAGSIQTSLSATSSDLIPVAVGILPWIGCTPLYIAQEKGFFQEAGLDLRLRNFTSSFEINPAFSAGKLDLIAPNTTSDTISQLAAKGVDYRVIGVMDFSYGGDAILARNSVKSIEDFKGKEIVVQKGGVGHFLLLQALADEGLSEDDIKIIDADVETATTAYETGSAEIVYAFSPSLEKANAAQKDGRIIYDSSKKPTAITDLYIASTSFAQQQPQALEAFLVSIFKGLEFLNTRPQEARAIAAKYLKTTPEDVEAQLKGVRLPDLSTNLKIFSDPQSDLYLLTSMDAIAKFLIQQGQIQTVPDLAATLDPQFLQSLSTST